MLNQLNRKLDIRHSLWFGVTLLCGMIYAPIIVGGANKDLIAKGTVVACVLFGAGIMGAIVRESVLALVCSIFLTWPAFGYASLMGLLRSVTPVGKEAAQTATVPVSSFVIFAGLMMLIAPASAYLACRFAGGQSPPPTRLHPIPTNANS